MKGLLRVSLHCTMGVTAAVLLAASGTALGGGDWPSAGQNIQNTRSNDTESKIGVNNAAQLAQKWMYVADGDISATPTVAGDSVYIADWGGSIHRINRNTGIVVWKKDVATLVGTAGTKSRTSPAVAGDAVIFGTQAGAWLVAVSKTDGHLLWKTQIDAHPFAIVTQSPVVHGNRVYVGAASTEEAVVAFAGAFYPCCSSRGSVAALDVNTGAIVWQTAMIPPTRVAEGFSGAGVWGSTAAIDVKRGSLYVTTGNNYSAPQSVKDCVRDAGEDISAVVACTPADVHFDSVLALDLTTGAIKWSRRFWGYDAWNVACISIPGFPIDPYWCPSPMGPDYDFAQGASLFTVKKGGKPVDLVGAGQKSGYYWALNPDTGAVVWSREVGPGGTLGGLEWGSAVDGTRVYAALVNTAHDGYLLQPSGTPANSGGWAALDAATGAPVWQVEDPEHNYALGPVSVANGVVYGCSMGPQGTAYAFNAATGATLWSFATGASCNNGPAVDNGVVYWGTGYSNQGLGTPNNKLYAFSVPSP